LATVSGPIHTVTNHWEPDHDHLDLKQNKVGSSVISGYDCAVNAIGQRTGIATSNRAYQYDAIGNRQKTANSLTLPAANNHTANALNQYTTIQQCDTSVSPVLTKTRLWVTDTSNQFAYRFSTKPLAFATELYYCGYRYYNPVTGRWPSRDPIEEKGGVNLYGFLRNESLDYFDDLGHKPGKANKEASEDRDPENDTGRDNPIPDVLDDLIGGSLGTLTNLGSVSAGKRDRKKAFADSGIASGCACCHFAVKSWKMLHGGSNTIQTSALSGPVRLAKQPAENCVSPPELPPGTPTIGPAPNFDYYEIKYKNYAIPF
jgi:RHS repeat-associated protein